MPVTKPRASRPQYELIELLERVGHHVGLSRTLIRHVVYLLRHTQDSDWEQGRAIVYKSVCYMARELGISERSIYNREQALADTLGLFISGGRRYGHRDRNGTLQHASGINLYPLYTLLPTLRHAFAREQIHLAQWRKAKTALSQVKAEIRRLLNTATRLKLTEAIDDTAKLTEQLPARIRASMTLYELQTYLRYSLQIRTSLEQAIRLWKNGELPAETSDMAEENFRHKEYPRESQADSKESGCSGLGIKKSPDLSPDSVDNPPPPSAPAPQKHEALQAKEITVDNFNDDFDDDDIDNITLDTALPAATKEFLSRLNYGSEMLTEQDVINTAVQILPELGISDLAWIEACQVMGGYCAALCVIVTQSKAKQGQIHKSTGGYFRGMSRRALTGDLNLKASLMAPPSPPSWRSSLYASTSQTSSFGTPRGKVA